MRTVPSLQLLQMCQHNHSLCSLPLPLPQPCRVQHFFFFFWFLLGNCLERICTNQLRDVLLCLTLKCPTYPSCAGFLGNLRFLVHHMGLLPKYFSSSDFSSWPQPWRPSHLQGCFALPWPHKPIVSWRCCFPSVRGAPRPKPRSLLAVCAHWSPGLLWPCCASSHQTSSVFPWTVAVF